MAGRERIPLFPSRANFVLMKQRIASAQNGLSLLKRKRDALEIHLRQLLQELKTQREKSDGVMQEAVFSLAKANFLRTDFKPASIMNPDRAAAYLHVTNTKIVGMQVPTLQLMLDQSNAFSLTGLANGGQQVQVVRSKFQEALKALAAVASLEYSVSVLRAAVKQNNMRVNGLEFTVLPSYQNTMEYIREELDEFEREDFYRLKRSQAKQLKKKSDFLKLLRQRQSGKFVEDPGYDFSDTHLQAPVDEFLAAKPENIMHERRKTVTKIVDNTIVIEMDEPKPLHLDSSLSSVLATKRAEMDVKTKRVVTSSSSSESVSSD